MFYSANLAYIAEMYSVFLRDPNAVDQAWQKYFTENKEDVDAIVQDVKKASWNQTEISVIGNNNELISLSNDERALMKKPIKSEKSDQTNQKLVVAQASKLPYINTAYRDFGHLTSNLDPLGFQEPYVHKAISFAIDGASKDDLIEAQRMQGIYCGNIGYEIAHIKNEKEYHWLVNQIEGGSLDFTKDEQLSAYELMFRAEAFEQTIHKKFPGAKRFSIEGGESTVVALEMMMLEATNYGTKDIILGMAHRGRLNVLVHTTGKPYHVIFSEFAGVSSIPSNVECSGDVKYHLGFSQNRTLVNGKSVYITLTPNPSHLESVNPVVMGRARARQDALNGDTQAIMPILIHGDAAMAGQGIVYECFQMANLQGYGVGGTIHIAINNQVGFTAIQNEGKSGTYCTDVAKVINAPVFHVNGNDVAGVAKVAKLAARYRQEFKKDVVIEVFCYRKYGHNEGDEPLFTQPVMYEKIRHIHTPAQVYREQVLRIFDESVIKSIESKVESDLVSEFEKSHTYKPQKADWLEKLWSNIKILQDEKDLFAFKSTQISQDIFDRIGGVISKIPEKFNINPKIAKLLDGRKNSLLSGKDIDWGTAELLAYGSLLLEGHNVRLSGEDCERGTFSHRHSVYYDQKTNEKYYPLANIDNAKGKYYVYNSLLSEFGVLGYEYGYSNNNPNDLVIWEAQFGDFANGAVTIHDQYISAGEDKWLRMSGIVNLLPHGFEGQGPEHSSARLERFLQLCAKNNMIVANCTTPANLFHILRRQVKMPFRKPLIIMSPKSLLRHPMVISTISEFTKGSFQEIITDSSVQVARKVVITCGKVYYDTLAQREASKQNDVAIVRVEQIYPFNRDLMKSILDGYKSAREIVWLQEEPKNMGAWSFIRDYLQECTKIPVKYCGRDASPSPATGFTSVHIKEQKAIIEKALS